MTVPANLAARHYAEQTLLAAIVTEHRARAAYMTAPLGQDRDEEDALDRADAALVEATAEYVALSDAAERVPDPVIENIAEPGTYEIIDCPGGAYVITEVPDVDPADRYDSGYDAAVADGRAADDFYGRDA